MNPKNIVSHSSLFDSRYSIYIKLVNALPGEPQMYKVKRSHTAVAGDSTSSSTGAVQWRLVVDRAVPV